MAREGAVLGAVGWVRSRTPAPKRTRWGRCGSSRAAKNREMFVNNLFASTGVPLLRELDDLEKLVSELTRA